MKKMPFTRYKKCYENINQNGFPNGVYIFAYHFIFDEKKMAEWEISYKGGTSKNNIKSHIKLLLEQKFIPIKLSDVCLLSKEDIRQHKFFAITFDDGYSNVYKNTQEIFDKKKIVPALFINSKFLNGDVYYRVLSSIIKNRHDTDYLYLHFKKEFHDKTWSKNKEKFFSQIKEYYTYDKTSAVTEKCFYELYGSIKKIKCHLDLQQLKTISKIGWEIGNHTFNHDTLSKISKENVYKTLDENINFLSRNNIKTINWVAYPNGMSFDVNKNVKNYMDENTELNGLFCGGGINIFSSKLEWMRIPVGNQTRDQFINLLKMNAVKSLYSFA